MGVKLVLQIRVSKCYQTQLSKFSKYQGWNYFFKLGDENRNQWIKDELTDCFIIYQII